MVQVAAQLCRSPFPCQVLCPSSSLQMLGYIWISFHTVGPSVFCVYCKCLLTKFPDLYKPGEGGPGSFTTYPFPSHITLALSHIFPDSLVQLTKEEGVPFWSCFWRMQPVRPHQPGLTIRFLFPRLEVLKVFLPRP